LEAGIEKAFSYPRSEHVDQIPFSLVLEMVDYFSHRTGGFVRCDGAGEGWISCAAVGATRYEGRFS
jgi:hypothetical protein